jgi:hypothetical protein
MGIVLEENSKEYFKKFIAKELKDVFIKIYF